MNIRIWLKQNRIRIGLIYISLGTEQIPASFVLIVQLFWMMDLCVQFQFKFKKFRFWFDMWIIIHCCGYVDELLYYNGVFMTSNSDWFEVLGCGPILLPLVAFDFETLNWKLDYGSDMAIYSIIYTIMCENLTVLSYF